MPGFAGFKTETAVALSNITIVGGAISNFLFNVGRRHAYFDKPLIDWELILVMEPTTILGALIGGYLNKVGLECFPSIALSPPACAIEMSALCKDLCKAADMRRTADKTAGPLQKPGP